MNFIDSHVRRTDPDTSREAAAVAEGGVMTAKDIIKAVMMGPYHGAPVTGEEIAKFSEQFGVDYYAVERRLPGLEKDGIVERTGETRANSRGRQCTVWKLI